MELKLSRNVDAHVVGGTGADVNNGMFSKFLRQAMGRVAQGRPDRVTIIDEATERYGQELAAPGNAGRTVIPFDVMNSVLQEHGLPTFPSRRVGGRTRYNYVDADGQRSAGGEAFFEFSRGYARQRELGELFFYRAIQRYNDSVTIRECWFVKEHFGFLEWNTAADGTGTRYMPGASYATNAALALYAIWEKATVPVYVSDGDGIYESDAVYVNADGEICECAVYVNIDGEIKEIV